MFVLVFDLDLDLDLGKVIKQLIFQFFG